MRILSIDFGIKYVGLAVADSEIKIAMPFKILKVKNKNQLFGDLKEIIRAERVNKIVVGRPVGLRGNITNQTKLTDDFVDSLKKQTKLPLSFFDEKMTSKLADKMLGGKSKNHSIAATIILQDYLNKNFK